MIWGEELHSRSQSEKTKQLLHVVADDLDRADALLQSAANVGYEPLETVLRPILGARGKRLRPALVLLAAKQGEYDPERLLPAAAAVELLHTASLIHDDTLDRASTRRGVPTIHSALSDKVSVLVGDYLFAKSADFAAKTRSLRVMEIFAQVLMTIADGQLQELLVPMSTESLKREYYRRIACKTASLFRASAEIGATLGNVDEVKAEALRQYGFHFGMAFQIADDILDFVGDEQELGKPVGSDLRQGTLTLPTILLLELLPPNDPIHTILRGNGHTEETIQRTIDLVRNSSALNLSRAEARGFVDTAKDWARRLPDTECRQTMLDLADLILDRVTIGQTSSGE